MGCTGAFRSSAWPSRRDRIIEWGALIWDCGHGGGDGPDGEDVYQTEIHPHVGWVVYRHLADADGLPMEDGKRTRNWIWYGNGDLLGAGERITSQGGTLSTVLQATIADAFFSSWGGDAPESINGCDGEDAPCTQDNEWFMPLLNQDYTFFVPAPPKPPVDPSPAHRYSSGNQKITAPKCPVTRHRSATTLCRLARRTLRSTAVNIGAPTCSTILTPYPDDDANGTPGIQVTVRHSRPASLPRTCTSRSRSGTKCRGTTCRRSQPGRHVRRPFQQVKVWRSGDDGDAEWAWALRATRNGSSRRRQRRRRPPFLRRELIDDNDDDCRG